MPGNESAELRLQAQGLSCSHAPVGRHRASWGVCIFRTGRSGQRIALWLQRVRIYETAYSLQADELSDTPKQLTRAAAEQSCTVEKLTCTTQEQNLDNEGINRRRGKQNSKTEQLNGTTEEQNVRIDDQFNQFEALNVHIQKLNRTPKQLSLVRFRQSFTALLLRKLRVPER